ncbi:hypothetical protein PSFL_32080 [Pseudomonas sp. DD1]
MRATGDFLDAGSNRLVAFVHIIRSHNRDSPARLVHTNGDDLVVIQSHGHRAGDVGHRRAVLIHQGRGIDDLAAFAHSFSGGQDHIDLVDGVVDLRRCAVSCNHELLEIAAVSPGDLDSLGALVDEHVIARGINGDGTDGFAGLDGDGLFVIECQGDVSVSLVAQGGGVSDLATFTHFRRSRQRHCRGVIGTWGISDSRGDFVSTWNQVFKVLATGDFFNTGRDGLITFVHIIRSHNRNSTARLVHTDGDDLVVIQGHSHRVGDVGHRRAVFIHKGGGVNDLAAFTHSFGGGQHYIDFVDGVVDGGSRAIASNHELLEVAAVGAGDLDGLGALVDEHVVAWSINGDGTNSFAGLDCDGLLVIEGQGDVSVSLVAQGGGVGDGAAFVDGAWRGQGDGGGVIGTWGISDSRGDLVSTWNQVFKVLATGDFFNAGSNSLVAFVHIIRCHNRDSPARLVHTNGDDLIVIQGHSHRVGDVSYWRTVFIHQGSGVDDLAAFTHSFGGGQHYIDFVDGVVDGGSRAIASNHELLEVAAVSPCDLDGLGALIDEHVIARGINGDGADCFARFDGDGLFVIECQGDVSVSLVAQGGGVSDLATFTHFRRSSQRHCRGVIGTWGISNSRGDFIGTWNQVLKVRATSYFLDAGSNSLVAFVHIIRCHNRDSPARLVHTDGDDLVVIQGHSHRVGDVGHRRAVFIHKGGGVDDLAAFTHSFSGGQDHIDFVDGVVDGGSRAIASNHELLEVAAVSPGNLDSLGALINEHVIAWSIYRHGADSFTGLDGDGLFVIECQGDVSVSLVAQGGGVSDLATFTHFRRSSQRHCRGVIGTWGISNSRSDLVSTWNQVFKVLATGDFFNAGSNSLVAFVHIIRCHNRDSPARLVHTNGDDLVVIQGHGHRAGDVSHRRAVFIHQGSGVNDLAAFTHSFGGGQDHINLVDSVVDLRRRPTRCDIKLLEATTHDVRIDRDVDRTCIFEYVVARCLGRHLACRLALGDNDHVTIAQGQGQVAAGLVAQGRGVGDVATFVGLAWCGQGDGGGVGGAGCVGHGGVDRRGARYQVFEMRAAGHIGDSGGDGLVALIHVVRRNSGGSASGLADTNGDGLAIVQRHGQRIGGVGDRVTCLVHQRRGVDDITAFAHGGSRSQDHIDLVDSVVDGGGSAITGHFQFFEVTASSLDDLYGLRAFVDKNIIAWSIDGDGADGFTRLDDDGRTVIQFQRNVSVGFIGKRGDIGNLAAFADIAWRSQGYGGGVDRIGDGGDGWRGVGHQVFKVATGRAGDGRRDGAAVDVDVVRRGVDHHGTDGLAGLDGDHRAVGQGHGHRGLRRVGQRRGVGDLAAFGDGVSGGEGHAGVVDRIGNRGDGWCGVGHQVFEVATGCPGNGGADRAAIVVDVVGRCLDHHCTGGLTCLDVDHRAVAQGNGDGRLRRVGQGRGVGDLTAFGHRFACCQGHGGGVDGVGDLGDGRRRVDGHDQVVTAGGASDGDADLAWVDVRAVIRRQGHIHGASHLAGRDGDHRAVGQGDGQVAGRRLGHRGGVGQHAAGFGDGRGGTQGQGRRQRCCRERVGRLPAEFVGQRIGTETQASRRETNGRINRACGLIEHHKAVTAPRRAGASSCRACGGGFQVGGRVSAGGDCLLQFGNRRCSLCGGLCQVRAGVGRGGAPLGVTAQVQSTAIGQLQADCARHTGVYLVAGEKAITFNKHPAGPFRRNDENLANNAFDDGNNTAH